MTKTRWAVGVVILVLGLAATAQPQAAISIEAFDNDIDWPVLEPVENALAARPAGDLRIGYDAIFPAPPGAGIGPAERLELGATIDVTSVFFKGRPADWIQWTFSAERSTDTGTPNLDLIVLDADTRQLLLRILPSAPNAEWGAPYNFIEAMPDRVRYTAVGADAVEVQSLAIDAPAFDFATLGFVFAAMDLELGRGFRLRTYDSISKQIQLLSVLPARQEVIRDARGQEYPALAIDVLTTSRTFLITHYVNQAAPYFLGWEYRQVSDGSTLFRMGYRGFVETTVARAR